MTKRINPNLDETSGKKQVELAALRAAVRKLITRGDATLDHQKIRDYAAQEFMAPLTIIRFAYGDTLNPSGTTIWSMKRITGLRIAFVPADTGKLPGEVGYRESKR